MPFVADRSPRAAAIAVVATWIAFVVALYLPGTEIEDVGSFLVAVVAGGLLVIVGFAAASRCRPLPAKANPRRARAALLAIALGAALGAANYAANRGIMALDPAIEAVLAERFATAAPITGLVTAPIVEEVGLRLFFMSALGWLVSRVTRRPAYIFWIAVLVSSLAFASLHLDRAYPSDPTIARVYATALMVKYTALSVLLGCVFWTWGLPYAIVCHAAANATHLLIHPPNT